MDDVVSEDEQRESLWQTAKGDFANAAGLRLLGVTLVLVWMAFQWGWGNDILLPPIVARAFESVDDGESWASGLAAIGSGTGAGALFWGVTQAIDGIVVLTGISLLPGITGRISKFLNKKGWVKTYSELSLSTRFLIAYASGASMLCLIDVFATGRPGLRERRRILAESVGLAVAGVAIVLAVITTAAAIGSRVPATEATAEVIVRYARNPLTWLVIYGSIFVLSTLNSKLRPDEATPAEPTA